MEVIPIVEPNVRFPSKKAQLENALAPINVMKEGIVRFPLNLHLENAEAPIDKELPDESNVKVPFENLMELPENALLPII